MVNVSIKKLPISRFLFEVKAVNLDKLCELISFTDVDCVT